MKQFIWLYLLLVAPLCSSGVVNKAVDEEVTFSPSNVPSVKPAQVLWKWNGNKAAEYDPDFGIDQPKYYAFNGRATLDVTSGSLTIQKLTTDDNGEFTLEVNNGLDSAKYSLKVLEKVSSVEISKIDSAGDHCMLSCAAEPQQSVTYTWTGSNVIAMNGPMQSVAATDFASSYTCIAKNPVSEKAKSVIAGSICEGTPPPPPGPIIGGVLGMIALIGIAVTAWFIFKDKNEERSGADKNKERETMT
ncbi:SLAM family member 5-like isoform X2 [Engraulis encrasicolus]|uniref:SLAM family member 5-like isoform X2 n=1 Tax=Engraulis encrasicolus TaxID=184585 RepID=UPI002FCF5FAC